MKKNIFILSFLFLIISGALLGQVKQFTIKGNVSGNRNKQPINNALIKLFCSDSTIAETTTDSLGNYSIVKSTSKELEARLTIIPPAKPLYGLCPITYKNSELYMHQKFKFKISPDSSNQIIIKNAFLDISNIDYDIANIIFFEVNSLDFSVKDKFYYIADTAIDCMVDFLQTNPKMFLKIDGYSETNENNKKQLSEQRAKKIFELLTKKGIDNKRIFFEGQGDSISMTFEESNSKQKRNNSRVEMHISITDFNAK